MEPDSEEVADGLSLVASLDLSAREAAEIVVDVRLGLNRPGPRPLHIAAEYAALAAALSAPVA